MTHKWIATTMTLGLIIATAGCGGSAPSVDLATDPTPMADSSTEIPLRGTRWQLVELMGERVSPTAGQTRDPFLFLAEGEERMNAYAGCNNMMGGFELTDGNRLRFSQVASTMMACPEMELEDRFRQVLTTTDSYGIFGEELQLFRARMAPLAKFIAVEGEPE